MNLCSCKHTHYFLRPTGFPGNGDRSENNKHGSRKKCQFCMKTFKGKGDLARHLMIHTGDTYHSLVYSFMEKVGQSCKSFQFYHKMPNLFG